MTILCQLFPIGDCNRADRSAALAAGGFILVRREVYEKVGGHDCVKYNIVEDMNLAKALKQSGAKVGCRVTRDLLSSRMYQVWPICGKGLAKAYAGMEYRQERFWVD